LKVKRSKNPNYYFKDIVIDELNTIQDIKGTSDKAEALYDIVEKFNIFDWIKDKLKVYITVEEIPGEIFIICANIVNRYNPKKGTWIEYLKNQIYWQIKKHLKQIPNNYKQLLVIPNTEPYYIQEEYYFNPNKILIEDKYLKNLTKEDKYIIYQILMLDKYDINITNIASKCNRMRDTFRPILNDLKNKLKEKT
jgi:hypothetical protein